MYRAIFSLPVLIAFLTTSCTSQPATKGAMMSGGSSTRGQPMYVLIGADALMTSSPGYIDSMIELQTKLKDKIERVFPGTRVAFSQPPGGHSHGLELMITVLDFRHSTGKQRFSGNNASGGTVLRVHIQVTDVLTGKIVEDSMAGASYGPAVATSGAKQTWQLNGEGADLGVVGDSTMTGSAPNVIDSVASQIVNMLRRNAAFHPSN
jgi:hypothetical protein